MAAVPIPIPDLKHNSSALSVSNHLGILYVTRSGLMIVVDRLLILNYKLRALDAKKIMTDGAIKLPIPSLCRKYNRINDLKR